MYLPQACFKGLACRSKTKVSGHYNLCEPEMWESLVVWVLVQITSTHSV